MAAPRPEPTLRPLSCPTARLTALRHPWKSKMPKKKSKKGGISPPATVMYGVFWCLTGPEPLGTGADESHLSACRERLHFPGPGARNRSTGPSTGAAGGPQPPTEPRLPHQSCSRVSAARGSPMYEPWGRRSPAPRKPKQTHFLISMTTVVGCSLVWERRGTQHEQPLLRSRPELGSAHPAPRASGKQPRFPPPQPARTRRGAAQPGRQQGRPRGAQTGVASRSAAAHGAPAHHRPPWDVPRAPQGGSGGDRSPCPSSPTMGHAPCAAGRVWG